MYLEKTKFAGAPSSILHTGAKIVSPPLVLCLIFFYKIYTDVYMAYGGVHLYSFNTGTYFQFSPV